MKQSNNQKKPYLLLSILLHATLLLLFTVYGFRGIKEIVQPSLRRQETKVKFVKESEIPKQKPLAKLKTKFSTGAEFTVPVLAEPIESNAPPKQERPAKIVNKSTEKKSTAIAPKKIHIKKRENKASIISKKAEVEPPINLKKIALANLLRPKKTVGIDNENTEAMNAIPKGTSILSLPKNIIGSYSGNSFMDREGEDKFPDLEDMKYLGYEYRIFEHLDTTWNTYCAHNKNPNFANKGRVKCGVRCAIKKDGSIHYFKITQPSGDPWSDEQITKLYLKAVPYPPIPNHFNMKVFWLRGGEHVRPFY